MSFLVGFVAYLFSFYTSGLFITGFIGDFGMLALNIVIAYIIGFCSHVMGVIK